LEHPFISCPGYEIPKFMPTYTLAVPLSRKGPDSIAIKYAKEPTNRLESTAPLSKAFSSMGHLNPNQITIGKAINEKPIDQMEESDDYSKLFMQPQYTHVITYIDASDKYGIGYVLTNGN